MNSRNALIGVMAGFAGLCCGASAAPVTVARDGVAESVVVVADHAPPPVRHAAEELSAYLHRITGGTFEIVSAASSQHTNLFVGPQAAHLADLGLATDDLGKEGIVIRTTDRGLILTGGHPRGTLYAVYTFLQDTLGCRWWSSMVESVPLRKTIVCDNLDVRYVPPLEYREPFWFDAFDADWAVRNKSNGANTRLDETRGGKQVYEGFVHTFSRLLPPDRYYDAHPEWYSLIDGKRSKDAQLCLTDEQMRQEFVRNLKERLRANPKATIASVSQNDGWAGNCQCDRCRAVEEKEGSPAGLMLQFVNAVAAETEEDFPNVAIDTLAYTYTQRPPAHVRPSKNVIVRLCNYKSSFSKPLTAPCNKEFHDDLTAWSKACERVYVWDYVTDFAHYVQPHPNLRVLGPNIRFFVANNVKGVFSQGAYQSPGAEMAELRAWVTARLLWEPHLDADRLIDEFVQGYYGPAADPIAAYLDLIHDAVEKQDEPLGCYSPPNAAFLSLDVLVKGNAYLVDAIRRVQDQPDLLKRVELARLPVLYVFLNRWNELRQQAHVEGIEWPLPESIDEVFEALRNVAVANRITHLTEPKTGFEALAAIVEKAKRDAGERKNVAP